MTPPTTPHTALYTDAATGELLERHWRLRVSAGPDSGAERVVDGGTVMIGSHADNDLVLTDTTVSRYHLEVQVRRDGLKIADLETTNGTRHVTPQATIKLGTVTLGGAARLRLGKHTELDVEPLARQVTLDDYAGDSFGDVLGASAPMRRLFALLARVAPTDTTVLLHGDTGTGKEAIAEAVHAASRRHGGPFVVVDCGSIPHELIGSELFGHVRGAYTGASGDKQGLIEAADGGTLFLDEVGELALDLQPQLLRVLDKRQVRRVGETRAIDVDLRVIAATHRDLRAMVKAGTFREDLYYRLAVVRTEVPPLRDRTDDIPLLAMHFAAALGRGGFALSPSLIDELERHDWPGNVRELRNVVERALSLGTGGGLALGDRPLAPPPSSPTTRAVAAEVYDVPFKEAKAQLIESFERDYLVNLLARHHGNISRAASDAGIDRNYIHRLIKKYGLEIDRS
jgi:DNA-binding NtrC family response regulator